MTEVTVVPPDDYTPADPPAATTARQFDVFLSHNGRDKPLIERIGLGLKRAGLEPWLDAWQLTPGAHWLPELHQGLLASASCAVCVGPSGAVCTTTAGTRAVALYAG